MLTVAFNHPVDGVPTDLVARVRKMEVYRNDHGLPKVRLDDWDVYNADDGHMVDLDKIDDPAGDELPGVIEGVIEDTLADPLLLAEAA